jgi:hypothetical protein
MLAYQAIQKDDKAGVLGLASQGEVNYLEAGTTVEAFYVEGSLSMVSVQSGTFLGKDCWIPTKLLGH